MARSGRLVRVDGSARIREVIRDASAEFVVAGRTSAARRCASWSDGRRRARGRSSEERGLRAIGLARGQVANAAPAALGLGLLLDDRGAGRSRRDPVAGSATRPRSTRGSCSPTASARTKRAGRRPRTVSLRTCSSPSGSRTRGCALTARLVASGGPDPPRWPHPRRPWPAARGATAVTGPRERHVPDAPGNAGPAKRRTARSCPVGSRWAFGPFPSLRPSRCRPATRPSSSESPTRSAAPARCPSPGSCTARCTSWSTATHESPAAGPGRTGDFLTAPESHPIFGWTIARQLEEVWVRSGGRGASWSGSTVPGTGALAAESSDGLRGPAPLAAGRSVPGDRRRPPTPRGVRAPAARGGLRGRPRAPGRPPAPGAVLANELLDALPVHLVEGTAEGLLGSASSPSTPRRRSGEPVHLRPRATVHARPRRPARGGGHRAPARPACRDLPRAGRLAGPGRWAAGARPRAPHRLRPPRRRALRPRPRLDPPRLPPPPGPRRPPRRDRPPGPDGPRRPDGARTGGERRRARPARQDAPGRAARGAGHRRAARRAPVSPGRRWRPTLEAKAAVVRMLDPRATGAFAVLAFGRGLPAEPPLRGFGPSPERPRAGAGSHGVLTIELASGDGVVQTVGRECHAHDQDDRAPRQRRDALERGWP